MNIGDVRLGDTFDHKFTTIDSTGLPVTLLGSPAVAAYPGNSVTEITAGITLTVDFDTRTGLNNIRVVATSGNGYATATDYTLIITAGTVDGVSVVGYVVGRFSIEKRSALMPTTAARTLDVSATGEADADVVNWKGSAAPAMTGDAFARLGAPAGASVSADVAAVKVDTAAILLDTGTDGVVLPQAQADKVWGTAARTLTANTNFNDPTAATIADAVWDEVATGHTDAGKAGAQLWTDIDAIAVDVAGIDGAAMRGTDSAALASVCTEARLAELDAANLITDVANVKTDTAAILVDTGTTLDAALAVVDANVDAILADTGTDGVVLPQAQADKVWGTAARILTANTNFNDPTAAVIADAVWDELVTGHDGAGKAGAQLWTDIDAIAVDVAGLDGAAMRGTDSAALASVCTEGRLAELDAANLPADVAARATPAQVNAEVLDVLNVDTFAEPGQEAPAATNTLAKKIGYLFKFLRNKVTQDATTLSVFADDGTTVDQKSTVSDSGTEYTRGEVGTGP